MDLLLIPSAKAVSGPGALDVIAAAEAGATVWASYSSGVTDEQKAWWWPDADATFGVHSRARYGMTQPIDEDEVAFEFVAALGDIPSGMVLNLSAGLSRSVRAMLPVDPTSAEVIAVDAQGRPAILRRAVGDGELILCTYPIELLLAHTPEADRAALVRIYGALAERAGARVGLRAESARVMVDEIVHDDGRTYAVVVSQSAEEEEVALCRGDHIVTTVTLPAFGATIVPLAGQSPADGIPSAPNEEGSGR